MEMPASASASFAWQYSCKTLPSFPRQTDSIRNAARVMSENPAKAPTTISRLLPPHDNDIGDLGEVEEEEEEEEEDDDEDSEDGGEVKVTSSLSIFS